MMKNKKKNRLLYVALSLVISIMLWMVALNEQNPVVTRNMSNVDVTISGADTLIAKDLVILEDSLTVNLKVKGPVLTVGTIKADGIKVSIDVSNINESGSYNMSVSVSGLPYGAELSNDNPLKVPLTVDNLVSVDLPVSINSVGSLGNSLSVFLMKSSLTTVKVTGPQTIIDTINSVSSTVNLSGITEDTVLEQALAAYTQSGDIIDEVTFDIDTAEIEILTGYQKTVDISVSAQGKPASGYSVNSLEADPDKVSIITRDNDIDNISVVVALTGKEKDDVVMLAQYNIDEDNVIIINPPKINVTVEIKPIK